MAKPTMNKELRSTKYVDPSGTVKADDIDEVAFDGSELPIVPLNAHTMPVTMMCIFLT